MVGRHHNGNDPLGLNAGFADPNPDFADWKPSEDYVPKSGDKKDSRFAPENLMNTQWRRRQKEDEAKSARPNPPATSSKQKSRGASHLDGNGSWADWGVSVSGASPYLQDQEMKKAQKAKEAVKDVQTPTVVPLDIDGMNKVLAERAKAASASTAAAYASGTSPSVKVFDTRSPASGNIGPQSKVSQLQKPENRPGMQTLTPHLTQPALSAHSMVPSEDARPPSTATLVSVEGLNEAMENLLMEEECAQFAGAEMKQTKVQPRDNNMVKWKGKELGEDIFEKGSLIIQQGLDKYKMEILPKQSRRVIQAADLYDRLHKVHELLFKQEFIALSALNQDKTTLLGMNESDFLTHYDAVGALFVRQWNLRQSQIKKMTDMHKEMGLKDPIMADLMDKSGPDFEKVYQTTVSTYYKLGYGRDANEDAKYVDDD